MIGHQAEIAGNRHLAAAAQREAVNCGNYRYRQSFDAIEDCGYPQQIAIAERKAAHADTGIAFREVAQVRARAKGPALPRDNQRARSAGDTRRQRLVEFVQKFEGERIHLTLAKHRDKRDIALGPGQQQGSDIIGRGHLQDPSELRE